jgi:hypothetical protein
VRGDPSFAQDNALICRPQMEVTQHARYTCTFCGKVRAARLAAPPPRLTPDAPAGQRQAHGRRHLELHRVPKGHRGRRVDSVHHGRGHGPEVRVPLISHPSYVLMRRSVCSTVRRLRELTEA